jgi:hypothetical protein
MNLLYYALLILSYFYPNPIKNWEGVYCTKTVETECCSACFKLYDDGKFTYESSGHIKRDYGSGNYKVEKDSIIFEYGKKQSVDKFKLDITSLKQPSEEDSISLYFEFYSLEPDSFVLPGGTVRDLDPVTKKTIKSYQSDLEGKMKLKKKSGSDPISFELSFVGYQTVQFSLVPSQNQRIVVHMAEYDRTEIFQKRVAYKSNHDEVVSFGTPPWGSYFKR